MGYRGGFSRKMQKNGGGEIPPPPNGTRVNACRLLQYSLYLILCLRVEITSETKGLSIVNLIEAMISQLRPEKVSV